MALKFAVIFLIAALFRNAQAIIAKDSLEEDVAFELEVGEQPWMALVELPGGVYCSSSIVSPTSLLSAATCLNGVKNSTHGVAYAGNVQYRQAKDFDPPTQHRPVVEYNFYSENNTLEFNIVLMKIYPRWIWAGSVLPVGVMDVDRLPENFTASCFVSGLGDSSDTDSSKVARAATAWLGTWRACAPSPQEHRMCSTDNSGVLAPRPGDLGGPVLCNYEPKDKLYAIISEPAQNTSEEVLDPSKISSHLNSFQFVGYYWKWINKTAGDLPTEEQVKTVRLQHQKGFAYPLEAGMVKRSNSNDPTASSSDGGSASGGGSEDPDEVSEDNDEGNGTGNGNATVGGAGRLRAGVSPLLALPLAVALRALY